MDCEPARRRFARGIGTLRRRFESNPPRKKRRQIDIRGGSEVSEVLSGFFPHFTGEPIVNPEPDDLEAACVTVLRLMVDTFGFSEAEARHRLALWRARQHQLEGEALDRTLPGMSREEQARELLRWVLEGEQVESDLRSGAAELGLRVNPPD